MLYHLTNPENVDAIQARGLVPRDNGDAVDPLLVAEETRDSLLDRYAREEYGAEYPARTESVFFYTDPVFAVTESDETGSTCIAVDEGELGDPTVFTANQDRVEDLFHDIKRGIAEGSLTDPAYDSAEIEARAEAIATEDFRPWDESHDADREAWVARRIPAEALSVEW